LKLSFDEDNLTFLGLAAILATFSKSWAIFFQSSGHTASLKQRSDFLLIQILVGARFTDAHFLLPWQMI
jgi:hypothetical protein